MFRPANMILLGLVWVLINQAEHVTPFYPLGSSDMGSIREEIALNVINHSPFDSIPMVGEKPVDVCVSFGLFNIREVDMKNNLVDITLVLFIRWTDPNLSWNDPSSPTYQVQEVVVPTKEIWTPDLKVIKIDGVPEEYAAEKVVVQKDGLVLLDIQMRVTISCDLSKMQYQNVASCSLQVGSWYYPSTQIVLCSAGDIDLSFYSETSRYELLNVTQKINRTKYKCCPLPFDDAELLFTFRRK